ncbi:hypothetical protein Leryth_018849 [Lithospermum erythrorhizon]|nr:hypothetical protein Leryth_018849 [Lithospermum erythrorhizon]
MKHLVSWNKGDPCMSNWTGVVCNAAEGHLHVKELHMMNLNLSGKLAPELGQLSQVQILNFMWNDLTGTIPKDISNITSLRLLLLNGNKLSGSLPEELGYIFELRRLQIDQNEISGAIPKSFSNLKSIKHLLVPHIHFNNNSLSGQIPSELCNLSSLHHLLLDNNLLTGYLPLEFSELPELRILQLDNNNFSGANIPTTYGKFSKMVKLSLRNCSLQGAIPDLSVVTNLSYLDLSWNQLSGSIPSNKYSEKMTTIDLSNNLINGSIPGSLYNLPSLQKLSLANNLLSGSFGPEIWQSRSLNSSGKLLIDLENNMLASVSRYLNPPENVTLRLRGNKICNSSTIYNIKQFCGPQSGIEEMTHNATKPTNSTLICPVQSCPINDCFEYAPDSPLPCFCAAPLRIGYRLKSPSFSYFLPYQHSFKSYTTNSLSLHFYQLSIDSSSWEKGPRLRMYLKLYPVSGVSIFNESEVLRILEIFSSWEFPGNDFFGPYELINFTLLGPYSHLAPEPRSEGIDNGVVAAIVIVVVTSSMILSGITAILIIRRHNRNRQIPSKLSMKIDGIKSFTLKEMASATNGFDCSHEIGQGGYGTVYKGVLTDNTIVAIKRAKEGSLQGEKEFLTEIELLSRLHHRNLVTLLGYCDEGGEQMLVYEFMPNGTLRDWLSAKLRKPPLNFGARLHIALGAAKGILYLHSEANPPIFHRDVKANNILLDSKFIAKVADFGLSRLVPYVTGEEGNEHDHISTVVKGTPGYVDPEYLLTRQLTDKSDVYSFGVVLLEILTGMHPISRGKNIVREAKLAHQSGEIVAMIDRKMGSYLPTCVERFASLSLWCCQDKPESRPSMLEVVRELENVVHMMSDFEADSADYSESILITSPDTGRDLYPDSHRSGDFLSGITITPR